MSARNRPSRVSLFVLAIALFGAWIAHGQISTVGVPASGRPVQVVPASAVNGAGVSTTSLQVPATGSYSVGTTAITSGTTHLSAGSGMAVANVGANSCGTSAASIAGNNNAFVITVGATSGTQCRVAFTVTAATEWDCVPVEQTTAGVANVKVTPVDTTHVDVFGSFTAGDKVTGICFPR